MLFRMLKKELTKRKGVNIILFLFITLATVFLASSVNNILVITSAVDYYMDYANVPDMDIIARGESEEDKIEDWLKKQTKLVKQYGYDKLLNISERSIFIGDKSSDELYDAGGQSMYIHTPDADYMKVYDLDGESFTLNEGEMALTNSAMERNHLKVGDYITLSTDGAEKEFRIKLVIKDAVFGREMVGMNRFIINPDDYNLFMERAKTSEKMLLYHVMTDDSAKLMQVLDDQAFSTVIISHTRDVYKLVYSFDMIIAGLLILIGICLILIALLVLRFTITFTIEEDYQSIGIMKAIGYRDFVIKGIYLVKYLVIVSVGAFLGLFCSIPVSQAMVKSVSMNMIMADSSANMWSNIASALLVVILVLLFCYFCTGKLNKVSAITAIRGGHIGERYKRRKGIRLYKRGHLLVPLFLGVNDILSNVKRYLVLMITFCISFILITVPLNTINTMQSDEMAAKFMLNPKSAVYVGGIEEESTYTSESDLLKGMARVEQELTEKGYDGVSLTGIPIYFFKYSEAGKSSNSNIMTCKVVGADRKFLEYQEGIAPELVNEIAFSKTILKKNNWSIGDSVETEIGGARKTFIITGTYADYMQLGESARLNPVISCADEAMFDCWSIMVDMETDQSQEELAGILSKQFPDYEWISAQTFIDRNVGGIQETLRQMLIPMTAMLCAVIMLITTLMERLFIVREKGEIAMMKSVGFRNQSIRLWQIMRMLGVVVTSMLAAVPLSLVSNHFMLKPIFAIMGADVKIQVVPWQVYGAYPGVLLVGIIIATVIAANSVKQINIGELNNLE